MRTRNTTIFGFGIGYCYKDKELLLHFLMLEIIIKL